MPPRAKNWLVIVTGSAGPLLIVGSFFFFLWFRDVHNDREHVVTVNAATPVFIGTGGEGSCYGSPLTTIERGTNLPVRRIRYLKNCATLDVVLPDGRAGYVVLGVGDVSVNPPLPTT